MPLQHFRFGCCTDHNQVGCTRERKYRPRLRELSDPPVALSRPPPQHRSNRDTSSRHRTRRASNTSWPDDWKQTPCSSSSRYLSSSSAMASSLTSISGLFSFLTYSVS